MCKPSTTITLRIETGKNRFPTPTLSADQNAVPKHASMMTVGRVVPLTMARVTECIAMSMVPAGLRIAVLAVHVMK
jgi:hypothetical protein